MTAESTSAHFAAPAAPFLKWAGGKGRILPRVLSRFPRRFGRYFEPFLGGGAVFFGLRPELAQLSDINGELINVYRCIRDDVAGVVRALQHHAAGNHEAHFYRVRSQDPSRLSSLQRAARMLYLNRTCFNGLYRVNQRGQFNAPFGRYANPTICPVDRLQAASVALQGATIGQLDVETACRPAVAGDLVYLDPPYVPASPTAAFTSYSRDGFGESDHRRLAALFTELAARGVHVVLSNSDTPLVRELYAAHTIRRVRAPRTISCKAKRRRAVWEVIVTP